jgi:hypothetical protein
MAHAMDWEKANRKDRANGPALPKPPRPRKGSKTYSITRLQQLIEIVESRQWQGKWGQVLQNDTAPFVHLHKF